MDQNKFQYDGVYSIKKEYSKDDFIRQAMIDLGTSAITPVDIDEGTFDDVEESIKEFVSVSADVDLHYTASIGYNREEQYMAQETKYDNDLKQNVTVNVLKTRTVTDWKPFSGDYSGHGVGFAAKGKSDHKKEFKDLEEEFKELDKIRSSISDCLKRNIAQDKCTSSFDKDSFEEAKHWCRADVESQIRFPGDVPPKNEQFTSNFRNTQVYCYRIPAYSSNFNFKGNKYEIVEFASGNTLLKIHEPNDTTDYGKMTDYLSKPYYKTSKIIWIVSIVLVLVGLIVGGVFGGIGYDWGWAVFGSIVGVSIALLMAIYVITKKVKEKGDDKQNAEIKQLKDNRDSIKLEKLNKWLSSKGYKPYSPEKDKVKQEK